MTWKRYGENVYRYATEICGYEYIEVLIDWNDKYFLIQCEVEHVWLLKQMNWTIQEFRGKFYVKAKKPVTKTRMFHIYAYPEYSKIKHVNGNGLDNRRTNIRGMGLSPEATMLMCLESRCKQRIKNERMEFQRTNMLEAGLTLEFLPDKDEDFSRYLNRVMIDWINI